MLLELLPTESPVGQQEENNCVGEGPRQQLGVRKHGCDMVGRVVVILGCEIEHIKWVPTNNAAGADMGQQETRG